MVDATRSLAIRACLPAHAQLIASAPLMDTAVIHLTIIAAALFVLMAGNKPLGRCFRPRCLRGLRGVPE